MVEAMVSGEGQGRFVYLRNKSEETATNAFIENRRAVYQVQRKSLKEVLREGVVSQDIEIPRLFFGKAMSVILEHFPTEDKPGGYLPVSVKEMVGDSRPEPLWTTSVLMDPRLKDESLAPEIVFPPTLQEEGKEKEKRSWEQGIVLLNEMATEGLTQDILRNIARSKTLSPSVRWLKPLARMVERKTASGISEGIKFAKQTFGGEEVYEKFRKALVFASLTGDRSYVNACLADLGYESGEGLDGLDQFAIEVGEAGNHGGRLTRSLEKILRESAREVLRAGTSSNIFPGVINIRTTYLASIPSFASVTASSLVLGAKFTPLIIKECINPAKAIALLSATMAIPVAMTAGPAAYQSLHLPKTMIHELSHYCSVARNHSGIVPFKHEE